MRIEQIIFDCDGVLVDSEIVAAEVMVPLLNSLGEKITLDYYLSTYSGKTFKGIFENLTLDVRINLEMLIKNVEEKVYQSVRPIVGMPNLVKKIELPKAVVSNSGMQQIEAALRATDLLNDLSNRYSSSMVTQPKPSPEVYLHAANKLQVDVSNCLVIEDSISGATAALTAGMQVIGFCGGSHITKSHGDKLKQLGVHFLASDAHELEHLIFTLSKTGNNL